MSGPRRELRASLRRGDFLRATRIGRRAEADHFRLFVLERGDAGAARLGITVTRKVGNAVRRNRIKRLVREWFRHRRHELGPWDLIVIAKRELPEKPGLEELRRDLDRALERLGGQPGHC